MLPRDPEVPDAGNLMADQVRSDKSLHAQERLSGWRTVKSVAPYLWPKDKPGLKRRVVLALSALGCAKIVAVGTPFVYKSAVDALVPSTESSVALIFGVGAIGLTVAYGVARLLTVVFEQLRDIAFASVGQRALRLLALESFRHIHKLSLRYHITRKTGGLSRIMERGVKGVEFLLRFMLLAIAPLTLEVVMISLVLLVVLDFRYFAIIAATLLIYVWFTFKVTEWRVQIRRRMNEEDTAANQKAVDSLLNYETVKYFGAEEREAQRYDQSMQGYEQAALKTAYSLAALNIGQAILIAVGMVSAMLIAAIGVLNGEHTVGDFVLVNAYLLQLAIPLNFLGTVYREIRQALVDMGDMFDLLGQSYEIRDKPGAPDLQVSGGEIRFENVSFGYDQRRPILRDFNLTVPSGGTVAIVGPSGSGKSTIGRLLFRFYDVVSGSITIDGQDVRDVTQASIQKNIGIVPEDTVLFNETLLYNISYGAPYATRRQIEAATNAAQLDQLISRLPEGFETEVGERGLKVSGGEKQRIGICRTLLKNPPILLLDEATSGLDSETEKEIQHSIQAISEGRTVIAIAHRLSTVVDADLIIVLEHGDVIERGTHDELLAKDGRYAHMWQLLQAEEREGAAADGASAALQP